jgi:lipoprotein NlpD
MLMNTRVLKGTSPLGIPVGPVWRAGVWLGLALAVTVSAGCSTRRVAAPAPVEDRLGDRSAPAPAAAQALPGAENAGQPGFYTVKPGDTLFRIALDNGQSWRDVQAWNNLSNPNILEVGQVLRVQPPVNGTPGTASVAAVATPGVVGRPLGAVDASAPGAAPAPAPAAAPAPAPAAASAPPATPAPAPAPAANGDEIAFIWPAQGPVIATFDEARNSKGVSIGGRIGDPVLAAADGRVVYAGAGLRGYGNLVILKHNNTYLTAYAHNQALLVREDQAVRQGQRIAEMGSSDTDRVKLHFEVRRLGKPVDPMQHLPRR